jgi:hypothetical protein
MVEIGLEAKGSQKYQNLYMVSNKEQGFDLG